MTIDRLKYQFFRSKSSAGQTIINRFNIWQPFHLAADLIATGQAVRPGEPVAKFLAFLLTVFTGRLIDFSLTSKRGPP